uniref:Uncharacterized protein n=1 Tax=Arundo donax TaxID=35708 RepID=A0A0A9BKY7_ARUDO
MTIRNRHSGAYMSASVPEKGNFGFRGGLRDCWLAKGDFSRATRVQTLVTFICLQ